MRDFNDIRQAEGVLLATTMNVVCCENCDLAHFFLRDDDQSSFAVASLGAEDIPAMIARLQEIQTKIAERRKAKLS